MRCLQPCLLLQKDPHPAPSCSGEAISMCQAQIAWIPGLQLHRGHPPVLSSLLWVLPQLHPVSAALRGPGIPRLCCTHPAHRGQENRRALPHLEIPEIPVDHRCSLSMGLPSTPRDLPSLYSSFSFLPHHSWSCLTLAGQGFTLSSPPRECTSSLGLCKGLGLD